jgi:hypothetical protein
MYIIILSDNCNNYRKLNDYILLKLKTEEAYNMSRHNYENIRLINFIEVKGWI